MAVVTREFLLSQLKAKNMPFYVVKNDRGKLIDQNQEVTDIDEAHDLLESALNNIQEGTITVELSEKTKKAKANGGNLLVMTYTIRIKPDKPSAASIADGSIITLYDRFNDKLRQSEIDRLRLEYELKMLALTNENKTGFDHPLAQAAINGFLGMLNNNGAGVIPTNGTPPINGTGAGADTAARLKTALTKLVKLDPDFVINLEKLATLAETNPAMYTQAVNLLNSFK